MVTQRADLTMTIKIEEAEEVDTTLLIDVDEVKTCFRRHLDDKKDNKSILSQFHMKAEAVPIAQNY